VLEDVNFGYQLPPHTPDLIFDIALYVEEKGFDCMHAGNSSVVCRKSFSNFWEQK